MNRPFIPPYPPRPSQPVATWRGFFGERARTSVYGWSEFAFRTDHRQVDEKQVMHSHAQAAGNHDPHQVGQGKEAAQKVLVEKPELGKKIVEAIMAKRSGVVPTAAAA